ncbi:amidohydrolase [Amycolatopsis methanolica]|uniref:amidohydrolase n=1 Tax=Amycolatopsis methanolica TaxID=1814 RepID=UPI0034336EF8
MDVDLIVRNARVLTLDAHNTVSDAVAVLHGRFVAVGDTSGLRASRTVDAQGAVMVPGFSDGHNHMAWYGLALSEIDLLAATSLDELYEMVGERAKITPPGEFILGSGYYHERLGGHPDRFVLDKVAEGRPVWLKHGSGHMAFVNSAVLERIGLLDGTATVPVGGVAARDEHGRFTGLLEERAQNLVVGLVTPYSVDRLSEALGEASRIYAAEGLTHVTEAGIGAGWIGKSPIELQAYAKALADGTLTVRAQLMPTVDALHDLHAHADDDVEFGLDLGICTGFGDDRLRLGPMKIWVDGGMASRTAHMHDAFCDHPGHGYFQDDPELMRARMLQAHRAGWRIAAHAIGDKAIDHTLDTFAEAQRIKPRPAARHRIEHAAFTHDRQLRRMAELGVTPMPQAHFVHDLGETMLAAVGQERSHMLYRHASFLAAGLRVPGSSDRPVATGAPLRCIQSMVERVTDAGNEVGPGERVDALTALRSYTVDGAWIAGEEDVRGTIETGKFADFVLLGDDVTTVDSSAIGSVEVAATFLAGEPTHGAAAVGW